MVVGILVALCAGIAICHTHHKRQRMNAFKREYVAHNGPLTKEEWKQLCQEHKQARKAEKHARKIEKHMRRAERRGCGGGCWRTSMPAAALPAPTAAPEVDVKYAVDDGDMANKYFAPSPMMGQRGIQIPVQGPDEQPPAYVPGPMTAPPEKM